MISKIYLPAINQANWKKLINAVGKLKIPANAANSLINKIFYDILIQININVNYHRVMRAVKVEIITRKMHTDPLTTFQIGIKRSNGQLSRFLAPFIF